jgi:hypothetical protein
MDVTDEKIEEMLRSQKWVEPGADFTVNVMNRVAEERVMQRVAIPAAKRTRWYERALMPIPAIGLLILTLQHARFIGDFAMDRLRDATIWLGFNTGFPLFAAYPILILGIVAPILAGAVASCAMSSHCRITRTLTN